MIVCNVCRTGKSEDEFYVYEDRIIKTCKDCMKERAKDRYYRDTERIKKKVREWQKRNPTKVRKYQAKTARKPEYHLSAALKRSKDPEKLLEKRERRKLYAIYLRPELFKDQSPQDNPFRCHRCGEFRPIKEYSRTGKRRKKVCSSCYSIENHMYYERKKNDPERSNA